MAFSLSDLTKRSVKNMNQLSDRVLLGPKLGRPSDAWWKTSQTSARSAQWQVLTRPQLPVTVVHIHRIMQQYTNSTHGLRSGSDRSCSTCAYSRLNASVRVSAVQRGKRSEGGKSLSGKHPIIIPVDPLGSDPWRYELAST